VISIKLGRQTKKGNGMLQRHLAIFVGLSALALGALTAQADTALKYPPAPRDSTVDDYHGTKVPDPYRGLENLDSPATRTWVQAESQLTESYFAALPARTQLRSRFTKLFDVERLGQPFQAGGHYFFTRNTGLQNQSVLYVAESLDAAPSVAIDPNTLSKDGSLDVVGYVASHDGKLVAYGISISGSDWTDWHIRNLVTGKDLPDQIRFTKYYKPIFSKDDRGLYYSAFPAPPAATELSAPDIDDGVFFHALGKAAATDRKILQFKAHRDWQYEPQLSDDGRWLIVSVGEGEVGDKGLENIYLLDLVSPAKPAAPVFEGFSAAYVYAGSDDGRIFFVTSLAAPNGKVISVDPLRPNAQASTVLPEGRDAIDLTESSVTLVDHQLIVRSIHDAHSRVVTYGLNGVQKRDVSLPGTGTATGFSGRPGDRETFYSYNDMLAPKTVFRYDLESGQSTLYRSPRTNFDAQAYEQRQVFYAGKDGTRIPMLLAYRKGMKLDGSNPVLLYAYGGFGISLLPEFSPSRIAWMELGGIYAVANIRGGGEYGEAWHQQAYHEHRQVAFDDFISAGEWLIAQHYTTTAKLAIQGESNGGLLMGACVTQRPDLYGAVIAAVGVMDMLRFDLFGQGGGWTGEFGTPGNAAEFPAIYAYSPLHHLRAGTHYPATLIVTGDHDTRVMPAHSFKFAATMQAAQAGPEPILLDIESSSGHGGGSTVSQAIEQTADIYAFLADRLHMQL
jgi:prolyl oligopeptidase